MRCESDCGRYTIVSSVQRKNAQKWRLMQQRKAQQIELNRLREIATFVERRDIGEEDEDKSLTHVGHNTNQEEENGVSPPQQRYFMSSRGKTNYQIQFRPINMTEYHAPKKRPPIETGTSMKPNHVSACTCSECEKYLRRSKRIVSRVYYHTSIRLIQAVLENGGVYSTSCNDNWNVFWSSQHIKSTFFQAMTKHQRVNQFPRTHEYTRKDNLSKNMSIMSDLFGHNHFGFLPQSFILPKEKDALHAEWAKDKEAPWIVKPATAACGRGIFITNRFEDFPLAGLDEFVVVRYINNPLLLNGYKFDMRLYVAVTSFNPLKIYLHDEGLARLATEKYAAYDETNASNRYIHLTNYSINKYNENFSVRVNSTADSEKPGSKWTLSDLRSYFDKHNLNYALVMERIEDVTIKTILSGESKIYSACEMFVPNRNNCFELFGFDVLLDESLRPWLLEVNFSPSMACDSQLDLDIKSRVVSDLLNLADIRPEETPNGKKRGSVENGGLELKHQTDDFLRKKIVRETQEEYTRRGQFRRLFPRENSFRYKEFFEKPRKLNEILIDHEFGRSKQINSKKEMEIEQEKARRLSNKAGNCKPKKK